MKKPHIRFLPLGLGTLLVLLMGACGGKNNSIPILSPDDVNSSGQKPVPAVAPRFAESQFQVGQWIQWKKVSHTGLKECERWELVRKDHWIRIEGRLSLDCQNWFPDYLEKITFDPRTGKVIEDIVHAGEYPQNGSHKNIYERWYGSDSKVIYSSLRTKFNSQLYQVFRIQGETREYFDHDAHPFHGIGLRFEEKNDDLKWRYSYDQSYPELPSLTSQSQSH